MVKLAVKLPPAIQPPLRIEIIRVYGTIYMHKATGDRFMYYLQYEFNLCASYVCDEGL